MRKTWARRAETKGERKERSEESGERIRTGADAAEVAFEIKSPLVERTCC